MAYAKHIPSGISTLKYATHYKNTQMRVSDNENITRTASIYGHFIQSSCLTKPDVPSPYLFLLSFRSDYDDATLIINRSTGRTDRNVTIIRLSISNRRFAEMSGLRKVIVTRRPLPVQVKLQLYIELV